MGALAPPLGRGAPGAGLTSVSAGGGIPAGSTPDRGGWVRPLADGRQLWLRVTERADGDLRSDLDPGELSARRAALAPGPWAWLRQVHGARVVTVPSGGGGAAAVAGTEADAAVTAAGGAVLAVHTADCAPLALWSEAGVIGVAHVGWRGLRAGVIDRTVEAMAALGGAPVGAVLGPCIEAGCYAFGPQDLATVVERVGPAARGRTSSGDPALDLRGGIRARLLAQGVPLDEALWQCTACDRRYFSHRARRDRGRSALLAALLDPVDGPDNGLLALTDGPGDGETSQ